MMRELARRLKRMAFGWSEEGAANPTFAVVAENCDFKKFFPAWYFRIATNAPKPCVVKTYSIARLSL